MNDHTHDEPISADGGLRVDDSHVIPRSELEWRVSRAGGAGGQHVNKTSTRVECRWQPASSTALSDEEKARVAERLRTRLDSEGVLRVVSAETRSQLRNREAAERRLAELVTRALTIEKKRRKTKPTRAAREARLESKRQHSEKKGARRWRGDE